MTYIHKHELLKPDHSTTNEARQRLAPLIGAIMLAWNEVELWLNRNIRDDRLPETAFGEEPRRQLSHKVEENLNEWIRRFMPPQSSGLTSDELRQLFRNLKDVRDDLAHNVWNYGVDLELGPFVNRVRENTKFYREDAHYQDKVRAGDSRNMTPAPRQFDWYCYIEEGLTRALADMIQLKPTLITIYADAMLVD